MMIPRLGWIAALLLLLALLQLHERNAAVVAFLVVGPTTTTVTRTTTTIRNQPAAFVLLEQQQRLSRLVRSSRTSSTRLYENKLWDRLGIEEDEEPVWYLINCVATNELDLLRQCQTVTADMPDAQKFVVPLERKTRSHGANKMVTEEKVKYPGYVFAKLRLCPEVYEAIQTLDLCRSWMGNVNRKGYKKLPPIPIALNELEVENFGLEEMEEMSLDDEESQKEEGEDEEGIIVDSEEDYNEEYGDPMYRGIDKEALMQFKGLKVEDMVKVTKQGKFYNEDGIVRRLKDGKIFVRFYTYGTLFEEWLDPDDVRKLTAEEVKNGLGGPSQPITQRDFDGPGDGSYGGGPYRGDLRQTLTGTLRGRAAGVGPGQQRNRRQDRMASRYNSRDIGARTMGDQRREERNWDWFKEQQAQKQGRDMVDQDWRMRAGSSRDGNNNNNDNNWAQGDVDSQWGRKSQRQTRKDNRRTRQHQRDNRQTEAAIDGADDWSAFVSSSSSPAGATGTSDLSVSSKDSAADDFFASLMTDLSEDLSTSGGSGQQEEQSNSAGNGADGSATEDDFFASLMADLATEDNSNFSASRAPAKKETRQPSSTRDDNTVGMGQDNDLFATLEAELGTALDASDTSAASSVRAMSDEMDDFSTSGGSGQQEEQSNFAGNGADGSASEVDFFASLMADLATEDNSNYSVSVAPAKKGTRQLSSTREDDNTVGMGQDDDFFATLEAELGTALDASDTAAAAPDREMSDETDDFFTQLGAELSTSLAEETPPANAVTEAPAKAVSSTRKQQTASSSSVASLSAGELNEKTVLVLKDMLRERGLKVGGKKAELVDRLLSSQ